MFHSTFRSFVVLSALAFVSGCSSKQEEVKPDPALPANAPGNASASAGTSSSDPPPNNKKGKQSGTLQDKACGSTIIKDGFAGLVRVFAKFQKDGKTVIVDPCLDGGGSAVSYERFKAKSGREDFKILSSECVDGENCWFRVYNLEDAKTSKLAYKSLSDLKLAGSYKDGESIVQIPSDAKFVVGLMTDGDGTGTKETGKVITKYVYQGSKPTDLAPVMARLDKLDQRMTDAEGKISGLVIAMAAYSDMVRRDEAM